MSDSNKKEQEELQRVPRGHLSPPDRATLEALFNSLDSRLEKRRQIAWTKLLSAYKPKFLAFLRRNYPIWPEADHDAVVAAAFIKAVENLKLLLAAESRHAYFWTIFRNAVTDHEREQNKGGLGSTLEKAQDRVATMLRRGPHDVDADAIAYIAKRYRSHQDDLDRATYRVARVAARFNERVTLRLARDALIDFEPAGRGGVDVDALPDVESQDLATQVDLTRIGEAFKDCFVRVLTEYRERFPLRQQYIDLRVIGGLSNAEIEAARGSSPGATREFLSKCKQKFEELLEQLCGHHAAIAAQDML